MTRSPSLQPGRRIAFDAFQMDVAGHRLWRGDREIVLRPKAWDVLFFLLERPGLLVTKESLHREIWPDTAVTDDTLTKSIGELRQALGDSSRAPRLIQTVHGRGFRFVAEVRGLDEVPGPNVSGDSGQETASPDPGEVALPFVGRQSELARLHECLRRASQGTRQLVFITGEAGIGKTTLTEEFLSSPELRGPDVCVLRGQCIRQYGQREPYMPVLEAFERLLSSPAGPALIPLFRRIAPCWYVQIPWLLSEGEPPGFQGAMMAASPQRMLREIGAFLESMAARSTVILVLEDLHWSDHATTDLVSFLAERRDPAHLLMIGTYRPAEASTHEHPIREVRRTLRSHRRCVDLALDYLSAADVREYLQRRFGDRVQDVAPVIHRRTDGNPLFVVALVEELIRRGELTDAGGGWVADSARHADLAVPLDLLEMVTAQFQSLGADARAVLEAASVAGVSFAPWTVARALGRDPEDVEAVALYMVRSHMFLTGSGRAEDSGPARLYEFSHALHHQVIYEQIPDGRRRRLHQAIGEALESANGDRLAEVAPELSIHFERSGDHARAIRYLGHCIGRAQQRFAYQEAIGYGRNALALVEHLTDTPLRHRLELDVRLLLGVSLNFARGYSSAEVRENYEQARALCEKVGDARQAFEIVHALWYRQVTGRDPEGARRSIEELERVSGELDGANFRWRARLARGRTELWDGCFGAAVPLLLQCLDEIQRQPIEVTGGAYGVDPVLAAFSECGVALWFAGYPDQARAHQTIGLAHAQKGRRPFDLAASLSHVAGVELFCGNMEAVAEAAARAAEVCAAQEIVAFRGMSRFFQGAALAERGEIDAGISQMIDGMAEQRAATGAALFDVQLALVATAHGRAGRWDEGIRCADEGIALSDRMPARLYAAELWRVKGELLLGKARAAKRGRAVAADRAVDAARECLHRALEIARQQEARSLELRAAMSLCRLPMRRDAAREARERLRSLFGSFTEGFDTRDLREARSLLDQLAP
ncbi:MAG TPA: AAA family ATPase [Candidatus Methylomirabilis sp.]|nr:AAA family ATPase [Candidatus Methylomirabilis sp.]